MLLLCALPMTPFCRKQGLDGMLPFLQILENVWFKVKHIEDENYGYFHPGLELVLNYPSIAHCVARVGPWHV